MADSALKVRNTWSRYVVSAESRWSGHTVGLVRVAEFESGVGIFVWMEDNVRVIITIITLSRLPVLSCLARLVVTVVTVSCVQGVYIYQLYLLSRNRCTNPNPLFAVLEQLIASLRSRAIWPSS